MKNIIVIILINILLVFSLQASPINKLQDNVYSSKKHDIKLIAIAKGNKSKFLNYVGFLENERERLNRLKYNQKHRNIFTNGLFEAANSSILKKIVLSSNLFKAPINNKKFWNFIDKQKSEILNEILISISELYLSKQLNPKVYKTLKYLYTKNIQKSTYRLPHKYDKKGVYRYVLDVKNINDFKAKPQVVILDKQGRISVVNNRFHQSIALKGKKKPTIRQTPRRKYQQKKTPQQLAWERSKRQKRNQILQQQRQRNQLHQQQLINQRKKAQKNPQPHRAKRNLRRNKQRRVLQNRTRQANREQITYAREYKFTSEERESAMELTKDGDRSDDLRYPGPPLATQH